MRKKNILVFHRIIAPYRIDFFNALGKEYNLKVVMFWRNLKDQTFDYKKIENQLSFNYTYCVRDELGTLKWFVILWNLLSKTKQDIVYVGEYGPSTILAIIHRFLTRSKYKIVTMVDDSFNMLDENNYFSKRHKYAVNVLAPYVDEVQTVEEKVAVWYQRKFDKGICFPIIADEIIARKRLQRSLPISEKYVKQYQLTGKKVLLFIGRLVSLKNLEFAIRAFQKLNLPNSVFVIVGSGELEGHLKAIGQLSSNVLFVGRYEGDELYAWYNVGQIFTLPSTQEAFGAVTNEALTAGCKSLISKAAGSNCLIENGVNGYVFDPYDDKEFMEKLLVLVNSCMPLSLPLMLKDNLMKDSFNGYITNLFNKLDGL